MPDLSDLITICVVTSPTASDPSDNDIGETVSSVAAFDDLAECRLFIGADGVRPEQRAMRDAYETKLAFIESYLTLAGGDSKLLRLPQWGHQANVLRMLLAEVTTPLVLMLEGDTPLLGPECEIKWQTAADCILSRELDLIRFHHESKVLDVHQHLMLDSEPRYFADMPYLRTQQWSQRPHLALTQWYRWIIDTYFGVSSRCHPEDALHGIVIHHWQNYGYERFKLALYADYEPTMQRSTHLDGRAGAQKLSQLFSYPGDTWPEGAPAPTLSRVWET